MLNYFGDFIITNLFSEGHVFTNVERKKDTENLI